MTNNNNLNLQNLQQFGYLDFFAKQVVEGFITGFHKSPFHGFSVEFAEHRLYNHGESTRFIDWKLFARTEKLFIKKFEEETNLRCQIIIDNSSSMYFPVIDKLSINNLNKIHFSVYATAVILYLLRKQRDAFGLTIFSDKTDLHTEAKSNSAHHKFLITELEKLLIPYQSENPQKTNITTVLHEIAEKIHKRSLVILFSDMIESSNNLKEILSALQHLRYNKHEVILFHVVDNIKELYLNFENKPFKFIDMETKKEVKVYPHEIKEAYKTKFLKFIEELKLKCGQYNIEFVEADINKGFNQIILPFLVKRAKLY
ncbi:MAG TPA: DUF58 domain-containing protein [Bacteroidales bacterium]|nr:DUF58 domain-containing protein [Bacteroidales bacterium]